MNMNIECPFDHEHGKDDLPLPCRGGGVSLRKLVPFLVKQLTELSEVVLEMVVKDTLTLNPRPNALLPDEEE